MTLKGPYFGGVSVSEGSSGAPITNAPSRRAGRGCFGPPPTAGSPRTSGSEERGAATGFDGNSRSGAPRRASARSPRHGRRFELIVVLAGAVAQDIALRRAGLVGTRRATFVSVAPPTQNPEGSGNARSSRKNTTVVP